MTPADLDALDAECARAMGWTFGPGDSDPDECWRDPEGGEWACRPSPTRDPAAFVALMRFLEGKRIGMALSLTTLRRTTEVWHGAVIVTKGDPDGTIVARFDEVAESPMVALSAAVAAWKRGRA
jgi:hypothetical protein